MTLFTDLPIEILLHITQHISTAADFLALCTTCHEFSDADDLRYAPSFWSRLSRETFRVPNQPVVAADGRRWCHLYRRMLKETQVYVWGSNDKGSLGKAIPGRSTFRGRLRGTRIVESGTHQTQTNAAWPQEISLPEDVKFVADIQCGGWSTAILTASGRLYLTGMLDERHPGVRSNQFEELYLPEGYHHDRVRQFSVGRAHLLALGDEGQVYSWNGAQRTGAAIAFPTLEGAKAPTKVVGGWRHSSCFIPEVGIVIWNPDLNTSQQAQENLPSLLEAEDIWIVSHTGQGSSLKDHGNEKISHLKQYGAVLNWIILENFVVWVTDQGHVFAVEAPIDLGTIPKEPLDLTRFAQTTEAGGNHHRQVIDIQGNLRRFAIMKRTGEVLTCTKDFLDEVWTYHATQDVSAEDEPEFQPQTTGFRKIPALQHTGVIQVAFGDWHFHALHADGTVSSYGTESQFCGVLGLGGDGVDAIRGIKAHGFGGDGRLLPQCTTTGRRVWFEKEKRDWMNYIRTGGRDRREAEERMNMMYENDSIRAEVSEWFEDKLRNWEDVLSAEGSEPDPEDDGLPAYYALSVAAAGWHSGALVLRNEKKANKVLSRYEKQGPDHAEGQSFSFSQAELSIISLIERTRSTVIELGRSFLGLPIAGQTRAPETEEHSWAWGNEAFPRLRLSDGQTMPGEVAVEEWTTPKWQQEEEVRVT